MRVTLEHMRHFQAVAKWGNLNLAASKIAISPSAVSRSIRIIEEDLNCPLFARRGRNIFINPEGERFLKKVQQILGLYNGLNSESEGSSIQGAYRAGASHWIASNLLAEKALELLEEHDGLSLEIFSQDSNASILKLLAGDLDFAVCFSPKEHPELESTVLLRGELLPAVHKKHPLAKAAAPVKKLNSFPAVIHKANQFVFSCVDHPMFKKFDIDPDIRCYWDSDLAAATLLQSKKHWSLLPDIVVKSDSSLTPLRVPRGWNAPYTVNLLRRKDANSQIAALFASRVQAK